MKGVILAGGAGTRLNPLTLVTNKHLLPLYNKPVIFHAVEKLVKAGVDHLMLIVSPSYLDDFVNVLGSGQNFKSTVTSRQVQIIYGIQNAPTGIADALWIAKDFVGTDNVVLHLGDNIIEDDLTAEIKSFTTGAKIFLKEVKDPERFGVATVDKDNKVVEIIEKPSQPATNLAVIGVYVYDNTVFDKIKTLKPSARGEWEVTDLNNCYIKEGSLEAKEIKGPWFDIGTFDSLLLASQYMKKKHDE